MSTKDKRRLTGYVDQESAESLIDDYEEEQEEPQEDAGSELSIPDADIDFDLVYALHTFTATVEGQASVVRGDALTLLDDSNSYWWLVKVLKTAEVGYIPAENIETPHERLARLNSHRNVEITRKDYIKGFPIPPPSKSKDKRVTLAKGVQYQSQFIYTEDDDDDSEVFESEFQEWDEKMRSSDEETDLVSSDDDDFMYCDEPQQMIYTEHSNIEAQLSTDSDIINDLFSEDEEEETVKMSLTPSLAQVDEGYRPIEKKNAEKLERLLQASHAETKKEKKKGIRKFFSRKKGRRASNDSNASTESSTRLKIQPGNSQMDFVETWVDVYPSTTTDELLCQILTVENDNEAVYNDYYLIVKTLGGDECTLVPSDKPLEIFDSLTTHLNTPMPSLKKARRISQMMGSDHHIGGPVNEEINDQVHFLLFSKTKRIEDGEFQIKVSLFPEDQLNGQSRVDKLVKIPCSILVKDAASLLLEKFHILNGVVADGVEDQEALKSLRLEDPSGDSIAKYQLAMSRQGQERLLPLNEALSSLFGDDVPPIHYRRNSNPDRSSITSNITSPEKDETYFILRCVQRPKKETKPKSHLVRHNTPMPRKDHTVVHDKLPNTLKKTEPLKATESKTIEPKTAESRATESMLFCTNDFGMNDLMIIIRDAASTGIDLKRLDQLEDELDRILFESIRVYG
ncbi:hypothetical protein CU098_006596 [Rhizopus stolonifer]|uniref:SH3 domain-containing protein n=1 Tax=Rhizopus stolonifer TaxID=4846 RepID=A0A367JGN6_RHIST|nr:hypothetical protein CU098_006596 [Rhizopus stolonifer]